MEHARGPVGERVLAGLVAPSWLNSAGGNFPRVNPGLCYFGHFGPQIETSKFP
jgi:hypothetical protein